MEDFSNDTKCKVCNSDKIKLKYIDFDQVFMVECLLCECRWLMRNEKDKLIKNYGESSCKVNTPLGRFLKDRGFGVKELAERAGVSKASLFNWVRGNAVPRRHNVKKLCGVLKIPEHQFYILMMDDEISEQGDINGD